LEQCQTATRQQPDSKGKTIYGHRNAPRNAAWRCHVEGCPSCSTQRPRQHSSCSQSVQRSRFEGEPTCSGNSGKMKGVARPLPKPRIYYYDPTPWVLLFLEVSRRSGMAVPNEPLTSDLGCWSTPTVPQLPDHPPPRHSSSSARVLRRPVLGRYGDGAAVSERGGARRRARSRTEAVPLPGDCTWHILPSRARARVGE